MKLKQYWPWLLLIFLYLISRIMGLTALPVFADESIYIRWSQLILDDAGRYLFFPLNDGKTPLFIWQMVSALQIWKDPLFAGRFVSVLSGIAQLLILARITWIISKNKIASWFAAGLLVLLPFWFFHQRMALMDAWLTLWLTVAVWLVLESMLASAANRAGERWWTWLGAGVSVGAAFWTKLPAVLGLPMLFLIPGVAGWRWRRQEFAWIVIWLKTFLAVLLGVAIFFSLKLNPAFSQLFARGSDFLYPFSDWLHGSWRFALSRWPSYLRVFFYYLTPLGSLLPLVGLLTKRWRTHLWLILMAASYFLPIALLGKVVYPRYFLPAALPLTVSMALVLADFFAKVVNTLELKRRAFWSASFILIALNIVAPSTQFWYYSYFDSDHTPFVPEDISQYLTEWSSGHGIKQAVQLMTSEAKTKKIAIATEGYFGTLPDAILLYLHRLNVENLYVEGIGQPVKTIPDSFWQRAVSFDESWLIVNSYRMEMTLPPEQLIDQYCRPYQGPCLQIWRITQSDTS